MFPFPNLALYAPTSEACEVHHWAHFSEDVLKAKVV